MALWVKKISINYLQNPTFETGICQSNHVTLLFIYPCRVMSQSEDQLSNVNENHVSTKELLNSSAQELIDEINLKRKRDSALLAGERYIMKNNYYVLVRNRNKIN